MPDVTEAPAESTDSEREKIDLEIAQSQLRKLKLEIKNLDSGSNWESRITRLIPLVTALISIGGFLWGINVYLKQQERDRVTKELERTSSDQKQYSAGYEQLLQFSSNQNMTVAQVLFLRQRLYSLIDSIYPPNPEGQPSPENLSEKARLQTAIYNLINKDCDFTQTRQVQFEIAALHNWDDYHKTLEGGRNTSLLSKYLQALRDLKSKNPGYLESLREINYDEDADPQAPLMEPYRSVIEGFSCHLNLLTPEQRTKAIEGFSRATNNPLLTADLFPETREWCPQ